LRWIKFRPTTRSFLGIELLIEVKTVRPNVVIIKFKIFRKRPPMSYKTILVSINEVYQLRSLLGAAAVIAEKSDSYVIGLYVIPAPELRFSNAVEAVMVEMDGDRTYFQGQEAAAREAFEKAILSAGIEGEFRVVNALEHTIASTVIEHARQSDLVIIGHSNSCSSRAIGSGFSEEIIISSGRPTLLMPLDQQATVRTDRAIVGWNGSREAARAAFDSIPLLKLADEVLIILVAPEGGDPGKPASTGIDLTKAFARHGIKVRPFDFHSSLEPGQALLEQVESRGAGLLVMGAYGHARFREFILGGATRSVLKAMTVPVLFSH
jgi:nucleotide-binding universal stress UspA family protein